MLTARTREPIFAPTSRNAMGRPDMTAVLNHGLRELCFIWSHICLTWLAVETRGFWLRAFAGDTSKRKWRGTYKLPLFT
ncbi:uncharacterized protein BKA78DRAFT_324305 [Phyllosticta capitalensis]|uniref:uncharacterized protein n=1 Tax=Phyllosticta capitalensis TaxID=121624 RepID=UPI00313158BC